MPGSLQLILSLFLAWPNSLVRRPPWLYASSVKNTISNSYYCIFQVQDHSRVAEPDPTPRPAFGRTRAAKVLTLTSYLAAPVSLQPTAH